MTSEPFSINVSGLSQRDNEKAVTDLIRTIKRSDETTTVARQPDNERAMDFGATLLLALGSGAGIAIARGIQSWMSRWKNASLTLSNGKETIKLDRVSGAEAARIAERFLINSRNI